MLQDAIKLFLANRNWLKSKENSTTATYTPPADLGLPSGYSIAVPNSNNFIDFKPFTSNLIDVLGSIYDYSSEELGLMLEKEQTVLSIRVYDDKTKDGRISFTRFDQIIDNLRSILLDTASFVINRNPLNNKVAVEANKYLNLCEFIETGKGSFVAKVQLPSKEVIKNKEVFDTTEIHANQITNRIKDVLEFVNNEVFALDAQVNLNDEYLIENANNINVKVLKDIETLYLAAEIKNIDFVFSNIESTSKIESQNITKAKINYLTEFIEEVTKMSVEILVIEFRGKITSLQSRDPDGFKNKILLGGIFDDALMTASANLDSPSYKLAIEAHKLKQHINIKGLAKKTKTKISFIDITYFGVED